MVRSRTIYGKNKTVKVDGYKGVYLHFGSINGHKVSSYRAQKNHRGKRWQVYGFKTAKDAALAYDKHLISLGLEPVNVLRRK